MPKNHYSLFALMDRDTDFFLLLFIECVFARKTKRKKLFLKKKNQGQNQIYSKAA